MQIFLFKAAKTKSSFPTSWIMNNVARKSLAAVHLPISNLISIGLTNCDLLQIAHCKTKIAHFLLVNLLQRNIQLIAIKKNS